MRSQQLSARLTRTLAALEFEASVFVAVVMVTLYSGDETFSRTLEDHCLFEFIGIGCKQRNTGECVSVTIGVRNYLLVHVVVSAFMHARI